MTHDKNTFAAISCLLLITNFYDSFVLGTLITLSFFFTTWFFLALGFLFPAALKKLAVILWIGFLAQAGWYLWRLLPLWVLPLFLILPLEHFQKTKPSKKLKKSFLLWQGLEFWLLMLALGGIIEVLGNRLSIGFSYHPAAGLFLLGLLAFLGNKGSGDSSTPRAEPSPVEVIG